MAKNYKVCSLTLTDFQKKNIAKSYSTKEPVNLRLGVSQLSGGNDELLLTQRQIDKINKHKASNIGVELKIGIKQLRKMQKGGILPFLAPLIPILAGVAKTVLAPLAVSAATAAVTHGVNKAMGSGLKA